MTRFRAEAHSRVLVTELVSKLRQVPPRSLCGTISLLEAREVVAAWRKDVEAVAQSTKDESNKITERCLRHCFDYAYTVDCLQVSPLDVVDLLFDKAHFLASNSWMLYRSAILHYLNDVLTAGDESTNDWESYVTALAVLIVVATPRLLTDRRDQPAVERYLTETECQLLYEALASSAARLAQETLAFARATLMTGVRPCEWRSAKQSNCLTAQDNRPTLVVTCGKRKSGQPKQQRTLIFNSADALKVVDKHMQYMHQLYSPTTQQSIDQAHDNRIDRCSVLIRTTCQRLWPDRPNKWLSLTDFRDQARANFVRWFGTPIATALMGHGAEVGRKNYSPRRRAYEPRGSTAIVPGPDVLAHALTLRTMEPEERLQKMLSTRNVSVLELEGDAPGY